MIIPAFSHGLYGRLRQLAAADWQRYVAHPFVQQLAEGTGGKRVSSLPDPIICF